MRIPLILIAASLLLAGCVAPSTGSDVSTAAATDAQPPETNGVDTIAYSGATPLAACAYAYPPTWACRGEGGENTFMELETTGTPAEVGVELTWDAESPRTEELVVMLAKRDGEHWVLVHERAYRYGPSPLAASWDVTSAEGAPLAVAVSTYRGTGATIGPFAAGSTHSLPQEFDVAVTVTTAPPAAEADGDA